MKETSDPSALLNPGDSAEDFFQFESPAPAFDPGVTGVYSRTNALWLMELCRLVYRTSDRERFLKPQRFHEVEFFSKNRTQGALVSGDGFAVLVFRGTLNPNDWLSNFDAPPVSWNGAGKVHEGFNKQLNDVWDRVTARLDDLKVPAFYTGHSLGAALATLAAARRFAEGKTPPGALYTFGSPRVGTTDFTRAFPPPFLHCRVVNDLDIVPTVPPRTLNIYHHVGTLHQIEHDGHLRKGNPNADEDSVIGPFQGKFDDLKLIFAEYKPLKLEPSSIPEQFTDHAPVNYSARIERTGDLN